MFGLATGTRAGIVLAGALIMLGVLPYREQGSSDESSFVRAMFFVSVSFVVPVPRGCRCSWKYLFRGSKSRGSSGRICFASEKKKGPCMYLDFDPNMLPLLVFPMIFCSAVVRAVPHINTQHSRAVDHSVNTAPFSN